MIHYVIINFLVG